MIPDSDLDGFILLSPDDFGGMEDRIQEGDEQLTTKGVGVWVACATAWYGERVPGTAAFRRRVGVNQVYRDG